MLTTSISQTLNIDERHGGLNSYLCILRSHALYLIGAQMDFSKDSFRWGAEHWSEEDETWKELSKILEDITREDVLRQKQASFLRWRMGKIKTPRVGGQDLLNNIIKDKLVKLGWESQIFVLDLTPEEINSVGEQLQPMEAKIGKKGVTKNNSKKKRLSYWTMDFKKGNIGVEVSFNNAGVLAQNLLRLSVMSESHLKLPEDKIRLGVLVTATASLKKWSNMDSTVLTYETAQRVFPLINFNIPTPIVLIGLNNSSGGEIWNDSKMFGHKTLDRYDDITNKEREVWDEIIDQKISES